MFGVVDAKSRPIEIVDGILHVRFELAVCASLLPPTLFVLEQILAAEV